MTHFVTHNNIDYDPSVLTAQAALAHTEEVDRSLIVMSPGAIAAAERMGNFPPIAFKSEGKYVILLVCRADLDVMCRLKEKNTLRVLSKPALKRAKLFSGTEP